MYIYQLIKDFTISMKYTSRFQVPEEGIAGLKQNWKNDISSGFSVFLISLPFCLGTALAAGFPALSGIITAGVGALLVTFLSGSHLTIKGPTTALAAILFAAFAEFSHQTENPYRYVIFVVILSGIIQVLMGLLNFSKWRSVIPDSVIFGLLAALGIIILAEQAHFLFGLNIDVSNKNIFIMLIEIPSNFFKFDFRIFFIGVLSLVLLFSLFSFNLGINRFLPSPFLVLFIGVLLTFYFGFYKKPEDFPLLLEAPKSLLSVVTFPDFTIDYSKVFSWTGFKYAISLALVGSLESLLNTKSIDALDIYRRKTQNNREIIALGFGNIICGLLGAMPMISTMVRSASNINNGAKTRWSNFFQGFFLIIASLALFYVFPYIPKVSVAVVIIYTAYRLNSPKLFSDIYQIGREQIAMFVVTFLATLLGGVLIGILGGIITTAIIYSLLGASFANFFRVDKKDIRIIQYDSSIKVTIRNPALSFNYPILARKLKELTNEKPIYIDFMRSPLVTHSFMELVYYHAYNFSSDSAGIEIQGLDDHVSLSNYPLATRRKLSKKGGYSEHPAILNERQIDIFGVASINNAKLLPQLTYDGGKLQGFSFVLGYEIKYRENKFRKKYRNATIEFSDILLSRGIRMSEQSYKMSIVMISDLEIEPPEFNLEKEGLLSKFYQSFGYEDINFDNYPQFSESYFLTGTNEDKVREFFTENLILFLLQKRYFNIESRNNKLLLYIDKNLMNAVEVENAVDFSEALLDVIYNEKNVLETFLTDIFHLEDAARREILEKNPTLEFTDERQIDVLGVAAVNNSALYLKIKKSDLPIEKFHLVENQRIEGIENEFKKQYKEALLKFADLHLVDESSGDLSKISILTIQNSKIQVPDFQVFKKDENKLILQEDKLSITFDAESHFEKYYYLITTKENEVQVQKLFDEHVLNLFEEDVIFNVEAVENVLLIYYNKNLMDKTQMEDCIDFSEKLLNLLYQSSNRNDIPITTYNPLPPSQQSQ